MILNVSPATSNAMLDAVAVRLEGANLELLTDDSKLLVVLGLDPGAAIDGVLELKVADGIAVQSGRAAFARAVGVGAVGEVFSCDVGLADSGAVIRLTPTEITRGDPVSLSSFRLIMP